MVNFLAKKHKIKIQQQLIEDIGDSLLVFNHKISEIERDIKNPGEY